MHRKFSTFPSSPVDTKMSIPYTSSSAKVIVSNSRFCCSLGLRMMRFLPSITFCVCWQDNIPSITSDRVDPFAKPIFRTFDGFAIPGSSYFIDCIRNRPIFVANLDQTHCNFSCVPRSFQHVCTTACHWVFRRYTNDKGFCGDGGESIDLCA